MQKENFLPCFYDQQLREKFWYLFNYTEKEARKFAEVNSNWIEIREVINSENDKNSCDGKIFIKPKWDNLGIIFHEIFHSAFHKSALWHSDELHKNLYNGHGALGEAFCDTFRYFLERELLSEDEKSKSFKNLKECLGLDMTPDEIQEKFPNSNASDHPGCHNLKFKIPTSIIIKKADKSYGEFKKLWKELNERYDKHSSAFLEDYFDFKMREKQEGLHCE